MPAITEAVFLQKSCFAPSSCSCWYCWVSFWRTQAPRILWTASIQPEIVSVIHYINTHYQENITLDAAAGLGHMSRYHFCRLFGSATGATFLEYLYNVRLSKVHQLLLDTRLPLSQIAEKCGFTSTAHLSRVFRDAYGVSPREFRKSAAEKEPPEQQ